MVTVERPPVSTTKAYATIICTTRLDKGGACGAFLARIDVDKWEETLEATKRVRQKCKKCKEWYSLYEHYG